MSVLSLSDTGCIADESWGVSYGLSSRSDDKDASVAWDGSGVMGEYGGAVGECDPSVLSEELRVDGVDMAKAIAKVVLDLITVLPISNSECVSLHRAQ